ncbi:TPA: DUF551 domain-containing protein [Raoultella planticola]
MTSKLTRERIELIANFHRAMTLPPSHDEIEELARMALAALDSEPVAEVLSNRPGNDTSTIDRALPVGTKLYLHAQPAPVVPDAYVRDERGRMMLNGVCEPKIGFSAGWNACRAAMLQELPKSAEESNNCRSSENVQVMQVMQDVSRCSTKSAPALDSPPKTAESRVGNSPVIPDGLIAAVNRLLDSDGSRGCYSAIQCGDAHDEIERLLAAAPHDTPALNSVQSIVTVPGKWIPVSERVPENDGAYLCWDKRYVTTYAFIFGAWQANQFIAKNITHWMPLPAAPQEVKGE